MEVSEFVEVEILLEKQLWYYIWPPKMTKKKWSSDLPTHHPTGIWCLFKNNSSLHEHVCSVDHLGFYPMSSTPTLTLLTSLTIGWALEIPSIFSSQSINPFFFSILIQLLRNNFWKRFLIILVNKICYKKIKRKKFHISIILLKWPSIYISYMNWQNKRCVKLSP